MTTKRKKEPIEIILKTKDDFFHQKTSGRFIIPRFSTSSRMGNNSEKNQIMGKEIECVKKITLEDNVFL